LIAAFLFVFVIHNNNFMVLSDEFLDVYDGN